MFPLINKAKMLIATALVGILTIPVIVVPGETISLWNFNEASGPTVADGVTAGAVDGTASANVQIVSGSALGTGFGSARNFSVGGSYVELGEISGTKLDLKNTNQAAIEAMIYLTADVTTPVIIFDNRQFQLQVINNRLAGFVRQSSGFKGIVASSVLAKNTPYRVGAHLNNGYLVITVANKIIGNVKIAEAIQPAEAGAVAYIGGDVSSMNFPGIIDDVRLSSVVTLDTVPPAISVISPDLSVSLVDPSPNFIFDLDDNEDEIDPTSIIVKLNGVVVTGLTFDAGTGRLSGHLSSNLKTGKKNLIDIAVKDNVGNPSYAQYEVRYISWGSGEEYASDSDTLGLWHLNDHSATFARDSSSYARHGKFKGTQPNPGVLGQARMFISQYSSDEIVLPPVLIPGSTFTFEAWVRPLNDFSTRTDIFNNDQISIQRTDAGAVVVNLKTYYNVHTYFSTVNAMPAGKWSHVKVVYDGSLPKENLLILIDGLIVTQVDAIPDCEFDDEPKIAKIGGNSFRGEIDEVRLSKVVRESINLIRGNAPIVELATPVEGATVRSANGNIYAKISDTSGVTTSNVEVKLNGVIQSGGSLTITAGEIKGVLPSSLTPGLNEIEIRVKGQSGNQTVVQRRFFFIEDGGLVEYGTDMPAEGLWHFNESAGQTFADSSGKNRPLTTGVPVSFLPGKFGNAVKQSDNLRTTGINFPGKSFTVEGWFKTDLNSPGQTLWNLNGSSFQIYLVADRKILRLSFSVPGSAAFSVDVPEVFAENEFRHVAIVFDGEADNSNLQLLVDGVVKYTKTIRVYCKTCMSDLDFNLTPYGNTVDEVRVSSVARAKFNVGSGNGPSIGFVQTLPLATVHTSQPTFQVHFADDASIAQTTMSLAVNGVIDTTLSKAVSGTTGVLSGAISLSLSNGANEITVRAQNQNGQESVQTFNVFYITTGSSVAYTSDATTLGLWHFDNGTYSEMLADVSSRAFNWNGIPSPNVVTGVFAEALDQMSSYSSVDASASAAPDTQSWTFETWVLRAASPSFNQGFDGKNIISVASDGSVGWGIDFIKYSAVGTVPQDGKFHHVAVIADNANPYRQTLLVVDGIVVDSNYKNDLPMFNFSSALGTWYGVRLDEMRLSNEPKYTLNYARPVSLLFRNASKLLKNK